MEISQELAERCVALVRGMAEHEPFVTPAQHGKAVSDDYARAKIIVAELPAPVDPDLVEVRERLAAFYERENALGQIPAYANRTIEDTRAGVKDDTPPVIFSLEMLRRGRELAALARSAQS